MKAEYFIETASSSCPYLLVFSSPEKKEIINFRKFLADTSKKDYRELDNIKDFPNKDFYLVLSISKNTKKYFLRKLKTYYNKKHYMKGRFAISKESIILHTHSKSKKASLCNFAKQLTDIYKRDSVCLWVYRFVNDLVSYKVLDFKGFGYRDKSKMPF